MCFCRCLRRREISDSDSQAPPEHEMSEEGPEGPDPESGSPPLPPQSGTSERQRRGKIELDRRLFNYSTSSVYDTYELIRFSSFLSDRVDEAWASLDERQRTRLFAQLGLDCRSEADRNCFGLILQTGLIDLSIHSYLFEDITQNWLRRWLTRLKARFHAFQVQLVQRFPCNPRRGHSLALFSKRCCL